MRVAITGPNGFVGRRTVPTLAAAGLEILPIARTAGGNANEIVVGDLAELSGEEAFPAFDACVHLAGRAHVLRDDAADPMVAYRRTNVEGTRRMLAAALRSGCKHFVYVSSVKAAAERSPPGAPLLADAPRHPEDAYGITKAEAEALVRETCEGSGMSWTIVRPPLVYGPGVGANFARLVKLSRSGLPLPLGAAANRRSMVFVLNLVDALRAILVTPESRGRTFYVSDGDDISTADLVRRIAELSGKQAWLIRTPRGLLDLAGRLTGKSGEVRRLFDDLQIDSSPIRQALNWTPPYSLTTALAETLRTGPLDDNTTRTV